MDFNKIKNSILLGLFVCSYSLMAQEWKVPEIKKKKVASFTFSIESVKKGEQLYNVNCQSCHGTPGKKNFANLSPSPGDPASEDYQNQTDGEMFYKITNGRTPMPSFKSILSDNDKWNIISFIRSFNKLYKQPDTSASLNINDYIIELKVEKLSDSNKVKVTATAFTVEKPEPVLINGADVSLFAKRNFGLLQVDSKKVTDKKGEAVFNFPADLPGDSLGNIDVTARLVDEIGEFGEGETTIKLKVGAPFVPKSLIDVRAMWSVRSQAPVWLIAAYCLSVIIVFGFIFYILKQLFKMKKLGFTSDNKEKQ